MKKYIIVIILIFTISIFIYLNFLTPLNIDIKYRTDNAIKIADKHNILLAKLFPKVGGEYIEIKYNQLPQHLINAVISAEDKNFFKHKGIDFTALLRAAYLNIKYKKIVSGGSTITIQLIRQIYNMKRTYFNKLKEFILAIRLEKAKTKSDIIEAYLNRIFFGNNIYGIATAAKVYLGKDIKNLSIGESAFLASIIKSGVKFNPYKNFNRLEHRRKYVLHRMLKNGYINKEEYELAKMEKINLLNKKQTIKAPHFCFYIKNELKKLKYKNIYKIKTTLDYTMQKRIKKILLNHINSRLKKMNVSNGAVIVADAHNGDILTMIGSIDFYNKGISGEVNGTLSLRQPGSALKPFLYAYIFSKGVSPASIIADIETHIPTASGDYSPQNYDWQYHGPVSIRTALSCSYNIPAVKWLYKFSTYEYIKFLKKLEFNTINKPENFYGVGIALGTAEVRLIDIVHAYTVFANKGKIVKLNSIKNITFSSGKVKNIYKIKKRKIISADAIYLINNILTDRVARLRAFPGLRGILYPFNIAIKTGTSKDYKDAWAIGYTKNYIVGIWLGNFDSKPMNKISGGIGAIPILYDIFLLLNPTFENTIFEKPYTIVKKRVCALSGMLPGKNCSNIVEEVFNRNNIPTLKCSYHKLYCKNIKTKKIYKVFTVYPDEYKNWVKNNNIIQPDDSWHLCNKNRIENYKVNILFPDDKDVFRLSPDIPKEYQNIELNCSLTFTPDYIEWIIDGKLYKKTKEKTIKWQLKKGFHSIKVIAIKDNKKYNSKRIQFLVQ